MEGGIGGVTIHGVESCCNEILFPIPSGKIPKKSGVLNSANHEISLLVGRRERYHMSHAISLPQRLGRAKKDRVRNFV